VCIFLYLISLRIFKDPLFAVLVPFFFALYPQSWLSASLAHTESLYFFFMGLFVWTTVMLVDSPDLKKSLLVGLSLGLLTLCRPVTLVLPALVAVYLLFRFRVRGVMLVVGLLSAFLLSISPWTIRNYAVSGEFVLIVQSMPDTIDGEELGNRSEMDLVSEKLGFLMKDPVGYAVDMVRKMATFWYRGYKSSTTLFHILTQVPMLLLCVLGMHTSWKNKFPISFFILLFLYLNVIHAVLGDEGSRARYSFPVMPYVIMFGTYYVYRLLQRRSTDAGSAL
jgi:hypothetical protein